MIAKQHYWVLLALLYLGLTACKTKVEAAYERALEAGVVLVENDTVHSTLQQPILLVVDFADGVNPIHYTWEIHQQDTQKIRSLDWQEFHFAPPDMVGGPAKGILSFQPLKTGLHRLVFYRPYMSENYYEQEKMAQDPYLVWKELQEDIAGFYKKNDTERYPLEYLQNMLVADSSFVKWSRQEFETHWIALQNAEGAAEDSLWRALYDVTFVGAFSQPYASTLQPPRSSFYWDQIARRRQGMEWESEGKFRSYNTSPAILEMMDRLLYDIEGIHPPLQEPMSSIPVHPKATTKTYHVQVTN
jgi:hypothetical protein